MTIWMALSFGVVLTLASGGNSGGELWTAGDMRRGPLVVAFGGLMA